MAKVIVDYELLRQPLHEKTLSGAIAFRVVYDASNRHIILSVDKDGALLLVLPGELKKGLCFYCHLSLGSVCAQPANQTRA
jgi:hypothetical protein